MSDFDLPLSEEQVRAFEEDGYLMIPDFFDRAERELLIEAARSDTNLHERAFDRKDTSGKSSKLSLWNHPGDNIWGMVSRCNRIVGGMEQLLGGEVYHYHSKLMLKEPRVGGAWEWHQDYGYWYNNGCLYPDMASCMIALDRADRGNGCLQVIKGSHRMGRIEHGGAGDQTGADQERVDEILKRLELVYCEMEPGTGLFFHGNLLHRSAANTSDRPRWCLICCYNTAANNPYKEHHHPQYTPLKKVPDSAVAEMGLKLSAASDAYMAADEEDRGADE